MDVQYRQADRSDLDSIVSIVRQAVICMVSQGIDQWDEWYPIREDFERDMDCSQLTVGMLDKEIVVIYTINKEYEPEYESARWKNPDKSFCILHRLCVNPAYQNRGIARQTMEYIEQQAAAQGTQAIRLDVFSRNPHALKLYRSCGFEEVGTAQWRKGMFYLMEKYL